MISVPQGWSPASPAAVQSSRRDGMVPAIVDAYRGVDEAGNGQPLTAAQVSTMAPFLAQAYGLPAAEVTAQLQDVRLYIGGPAAHTPWNAVTLGHDIYVRSTEELNAIESWDHRRWLAHECGHVMQYERTPAPDAQSRLRRSMRNYGVHLFADSLVRPGAVQRGFGTWLNENFNPWNKTKTHIKLADAIHDTHVLEHEAEVHAEDFAGATGMRVSDGHFDKGR